MSKLSEAIARKLEFDKAATIDQAKHEDSDGYFGFLTGAEAERARTASIDQLWPEVIEALDMYNDKTLKDPGNRARQILTKLSKAVGEE